MKSLKDLKPIETKDLYNRQQNSPALSAQNLHYNPSLPTLPSVRNMKSHRENSFEDSTRNRAEY